MKELLLNVVLGSEVLVGSAHPAKLSGSQRNSIFQTEPHGEIQLSESTPVDLSLIACLPEISKSLPVSEEVVGALGKNSPCSKRGRAGSCCVWINTEQNLAEKTTCLA